MKKALYALCTLLCLCPFPLGAVPGVKDFLPTESGQYVYYKDATFQREAYVGFLQYDEARYAIRYYAPENTKTGQKEEQIELFLTVDTKKDYILMTGERIVAKEANENTATLNYLHDLFYEFASQRKKVNGANFKGSSAVPFSVQKTENIALFGGEVSLTYDYLIPIFNLRSITNKKGEKQFTAVTMGKLASSSDKAFSSFTGIPPLPPAAIQTAAQTGEQTKTAAPKTKANKTGITDKAFADMEAKCVQIADNFWFWESEALMYSDNLPVDTEALKGKPYGLYRFLARTLLCSTNKTLVNLATQNIKIQNKCLVLSTYAYDLESERYVFDVKIIAAKKNAAPDITGLTLYADYYNINKDYFDKKIQLIIQR
jgi:hypothetical protein